MNRWMRSLVVAAVVWCAVWSPAAHARNAGDIGFTISAFSDPHPSLTGFNLLYHLAPHWRVQVGAGTIFSGSSLGAGVRYVASPEPGWSPVFGVSWASGKFADVTYFLFEHSDSPSYSSQYSAYIGTEFVSSGGFLFGIGINAVFLKAPQKIGINAVFPGLQIGWLF
jgi:hypothetical protein